MKILSFLAQFTCNIPSSRCSPLFLSSLCKLHLQELFLLQKQDFGGLETIVKQCEFLLVGCTGVITGLYLKPLTCQLLMGSLHLAVVVQAPVICKLYSPTTLLQHQDEV